MQSCRINMTLIIWDRVSISISVDAKSELALDEFADTISLNDLVL